MNTKSIIAVVALTIVLAVAGFAWRASRAAVVAVETERATLVTERAEFDAESHRLEERVASAEKERGALQTTLAALQSAKPAAPAASPAKRPAPLDPMELISKDPKLQVLFLASRRAAFTTTYGPLVHSLALAPAQSDKLRAAIIAFEEQTQDIAAVMREQKLAANDPAVATMREWAMAELKSAEMETLGPAGFEKLQEYERTLPARAIVERFAGAAALGGVPVSAQQAEQLTQLMAGASNLASDGSRVDMGTIDWNAVDARAQEILSGNQHALFKRIEPIGGGPSRWIAQFNKALEQAVKSAPGATPPGG